jgi:hypothetical protein
MKSPDPSLRAGASWMVVTVLIHGVAPLRFDGMGELGPAMLCFGAIMVRKVRTLLESVVDGRGHLFWPFTQASIEIQFVLTMVFYWAKPTARLFTAVAVLTTAAPKTSWLLA